MVRFIAWPPSSRAAFVDRGADPLVGAAAADVTGHGGVDVASVGFGLAASSAAADMIWPDWQ